MFISRSTYLRMQSFTHVHNEEITQCTVISFLGKNLYYKLFFYNETLNIGNCMNVQ